MARETMRPVETTQLAARYPALTEAAPTLALEAPDKKNGKDETGR